jgi:hypothetical protein
MRYQKERDRYCLNTGLRLDGYDSPVRFLFDLLKIEAFGSCIDYYIYDKQWWNTARHTKEKRGRRDDFGLTNYDYQKAILKLLIYEMFPDETPEDAIKIYNKMRDAQAKKDYYQRSVESGLIQEMTKKNKERRHNDPEYREHIRKRAQAIADKDPERIRGYKKAYIERQGDKLKKRASDNYYKRTYGDKAGVAKSIWELEKELRKTKKQQEAE